MIGLERIEQAFAAIKNADMGTVKLVCRAQQEIGIQRRHFEWRVRGVVNRINDQIRTHVATALPHPFDWRDGA